MMVVVLGAVKKDRTTAPKATSIDSRLKNHSPRKLPRLMKAVGVLVPRAVVCVLYGANSVQILNIPPYVSKNSLLRGPAGGAPSQELARV